MLGGEGMRIFKKAVLVLGIGAFGLLEAAETGPCTTKTCTNRVEAKPSVGLPVSEENTRRRNGTRRFGINPWVIAPSEEKKNVGSAAGNQSGRGLRRRLFARSCGESETP